MRILCKVGNANLHVESGVNSVERTRRDPSVRSVRGLSAGLGVTAYAEYACKSLFCSFDCPEEMQSRVNKMINMK